MDFVRVVQSSVGGTVFGGNCEQLTRNRHLGVR